VQVLTLLNDIQHWHLEEIPGANSISNRVQKSGYCVYKETGGKDFPEGYATIADESMMIGSEKLLLTLGVPPVKQGAASLQQGDVRVLDMSVRRSWNGASISAVFTGVEEKMGSPPAYVVSDNASTLSKAAQAKGYAHVRDVGHSIGLFLQQVYEKQEDFRCFMKGVNEVKFREVMRSTAYLLPPKQRAIARFMNLSGTIDWADAMLKAFGKLSAEEQAVFSFIKEFRPIIKELQAVFRVINTLLARLKNEGMSAASSRWCLSRIQSMRVSPRSRVAAVGRLVSEYITKEYGKLADRNKRWHISSDVIESMFGSYKERKSPNRLNGVTKQIFILPLLSRMKSAHGMDNDYFKHCLEHVFLRDLDTWRLGHLSENRTVKRKKLLCA
jgi:hypothetical protein